MHKVRKKKRKKLVIGPYLVGALFAYLLMTTQFFHFMGQAHHGARNAHFGHEFLSALTQPQAPGGLMGSVKGYVFQMMSHLHLGYTSTFVEEGLGFGGIVWDTHPVEHRAPTGFRFVRQTVLEEQTDAPIAAPPTSPVFLGEDPIVYIFNSHDNERFSDNVGTVMEMSLAMGEVFEANGIPTLVEERSVQQFLLANWGPRSFGWSYDASRVFLTEQIAEHDSLRFFFDLHRDAYLSDPWHPVDGTDYARIQFIVGARHEYFLDNLAVVDEIVALISERAPHILRNHPVAVHDNFLRSEARFNQDLSANLMLIEIGDNLTPFHAAMNTARVLGEILAEYIHLQELKE